MPFVTRPGGYDLSSCPPYNIEDCSMRMYLLDADPDGLSASIRRYLSDVSASQGESFQPFGNRVIACFTAARKVTCQDPELGYMHEVDCGFFIPVLKFNAGRELCGWGVFAPYLFVNNDWASVTGREVHGFRKQLATSFSSTNDVNADDWDHDAAKLDRIEAWAIDRPGRESRLRRAVICEVDSQHCDRRPASGIALLRALVGNHHLAGVAESFAAMLAGRLFKDVKVHVPIYFLRQLRDPANGPDATPQSIVEGKLAIPVASLQGFHLAGSHRLLFHNLVSHPFRDDLGLEPGVPHESHFTLQVTLDYELE